MKFYHKEDVEQEGTPILNRVGRRDTLMELAEEIKSDQWHQMAMRTLSGASSGKTEDGKSGGNSSATTALVISDSDLASSWIYTSRKEAANEVFGPEPNVEPHVNSASSPRPCCRRCCRLTVSTIIIFCVIGILSAIGGIIYLELFASQKPAPSSPHRGDSSVKLSGHHFIDQYPDWGNNMRETVREEHSDYPDEFHFKKSTDETSLPPRRGKILPQDDLPPPDVGLLHTYMNGTISAVKNIFRLIKDSSEQERRNRRLDLTENNEQDNFIYDGSQSFLQKLTSFLFGTVRPREPVSDWNFNVLKENTPHLVSYIDKSLMYSTVGALDTVPKGNQLEELGSGEIDKGTVTSAEIDLLKVATPLSTEIFQHMRTLQETLGSTNAENLETMPNIRNLDNLVSKVFNVTDKEVDSTLQRTTTIETDVQSPSSDFKTKVSASIAGLLNIFRAIDRITPPVASTPNDDLQENLFHRRALDYETHMPSAINQGSARQEKDQYLQRLRYIMLTANSLS